MECRTPDKRKRSQLLDGFVCDPQRVRSRFFWFVGLVWVWFVFGFGVGLVRFVAWVRVWFGFGTWAWFGIGSCVELVSE